MHAAASWFLNVEQIVQSHALLQKLDSSCGWWYWYLKSIPDMQAPNIFHVSSFQMLRQTSCQAYSFF